ncbi:putative spermidine/putrescine transport system permease protein [Faunimonas pinastri]|uniref:Putative spermidine/putrescine transport system permease protein n=1 Tax=Faunimonas pinastri TaxID=1855383 RepID=A0A1H9DYU1_9HYPH|nr:ABC transporter permease [Faunimonas pinastri]SEQ18690.1 putative spermidine/putrescine transport system permease protein [Faunimonas pinastri]
MKRGSAGHYLSRGLTWLLLAFLFLPILVVIPVAFTDQDFLSLPQHGLSLKHFVAIGDWSAGWLPSILTSIAVGVLASAAATTLGAAYAVGAWSISGWWPSLTRVMILSPLIVPPIVYAVGIFKLWARFHLLDTFLGVAVVHVVLCLPFVILAMGSTLSNLDPRLVQAARSLGARPATVFLRVIAPNILPGIIASALFAFVTSWDEITVTLFITSRAMVTLPRRIWTSIADSVDPALAAVATLMLVVTIAILVVQACLPHRKPDPSP